MKKLRIATSCLGDCIFAGRVKKSGAEWCEGKQDVTSDVLKAVVDFVKPGHTMTINVNGSARYEITVKTLESRKHKGEV